MQPSDSPSTSTGNSASTSIAKQAKHDKQESDISVYRGTQNTKEESSDESTIISSQTSTLTRNQGCDELQTAVSLRLEELANCLGSPEEEDEDGGTDSGSEDSEEEGIIVEFMMEDNVLEDVLEHEVNTTHFLYHLLPYKSLLENKRILFYSSSYCPPCRRRKSSTKKQGGLRIKRLTRNVFLSRSKANRESFRQLGWYRVPFMTIRILSL